MFTTDTSGCWLISVNSSGKSVFSNDCPVPGVYRQQLELVSRTFLHAEPWVSANSVCSVYVGGVTIWLIRRCAGDLVTRCLDKNNNIRCSEVRCMAFSDCVENNARRRLDCR